MKTSDSFSYEEFTTRNIGFVSVDEQETLRGAVVLVIGVGGMGGVALQCLVRSGIGHFIFTDIDTFEVSNLNRQIFSNIDTLGADKAETTQKEILRINPLCKVESLGPDWLAKIDEVLPRVTVVINGCDDARSSVQLMRRAAVHGKAVIDAFASPLPSVYVVRPHDPRPEEAFGYPTLGRELSEWTEADAKECAAREIEFVLSQSSSAKHVVLEIAAEMISGKRKRISFAPMVWATGVLMAYEAIRIILKKPGGPGPLGVFLNPWAQSFERPRKGLVAKAKLILVRRFLSRMAKASAVPCLALFFLSGCLEAQSTALKSYLAKNGSASDTPAAHFLMDDFGGLNSDTLQTNALPWKLTATYLLLKQGRDAGLEPVESSLPALLQRYGFITPKKIENWPAGQPQPRLSGPAGLVKGLGYLPENAILPISTLEISNINCSACHAGTTYDAQGKPTLNLWIGSPNSSMNLDAFTRDSYQALKEAAGSKEAALANVKKVFPDVSRDELDTIGLAFGLIKKRVAELEKTTDQATPFSNGSPGVTNGVASLKRMLKVIDLNRWHSEETAFTAIPNLGDRFLRSNLLCDGVYSLKNEAPFRSMERSSTPTSRMMDLGRIIGFFNVPVMGQSPEAAEKNLPKALKGVRFLQDYRTPPFPGVIDWVKAERGQTLFQTSCQHCHGAYAGDLQHLVLESFPNKLVPLASIGTDPRRANLINAPVSEAVMKSRMGQYMNANLSGGYVAPILTGVWARAPYLHNGSVPTLWHLMNPESRPVAFEVGGHSLDFDKMGIAGQLDDQGVYRYSPLYKPWSVPLIYHTTDLGRSNRGHEWQFADFTADQKLDLIEFLKAL